MRNCTFPSLVLCALMLAGCAAPKPLATETDIASAEASNTLPSLYNQARASLIGKDRNSKKHAPLFAQLDAIGRRLSSRLDFDLRKQMEGARMQNGLIPLNVLNDAQAASENMRTWEPSRHDVLSKDIAKDMALTQKAVKDVETYITQLPAMAYRKHMTALQQMELLTGDTRYGAHRESMLRTVRGEFEQARTTDNFEQALILLDELPPSSDTEPTRLELQTRLFERKFNELLAEDRPDDAYNLFDTLARSPYFNDVKERIGPTGKDMANYFIALASNATQAGNLGDAYRWFSQSRNVRMKLDGKVDPVPEEKPFVERVYRGYGKAKVEGYWGLAYGHLLIVQDFDPERVNLANDLRQAEEETNKLSIRSATIQPFTNAAGNADYSSAIATRITEYLFQTIPEDVRIISYNNQSAPVDYLINGSIDEARVETTDNTTRKTARVVTEQGITTRNPKYDEWLKLSERERKNSPPPPAQLVSDRKEDVSYNVTQTRKVGYFSVAFRVLEASTGKVVYTDSLTVKRELSGEGNEGVELGAFKLPSKTANLPTDIEILNQLSNEASQDIGKRLVSRLGDIDKRYGETAKQAVASGSILDASQYYSFAVVTAQRKKTDAGTYRTELKKVAAMSGYGR